MEIIGEIGLVVVTACKCELGPGYVGPSVELLDRLLEAQDAAIELGWNSNVFGKELREVARAETGVACEFGYVDCAE
jgi:hypothetical protein